MSIETARFFWHVECASHPARAVWIVCIHESEIRSARLVEGQEPVTGDALCGPCRADIDGNRPNSTNYRFACGACVRERWPIENAS